MRRPIALLAVLVALVAPTAAAAFDNTEPLAAKQWYLTEDRAWSYWPTQPQLFPVTVAVIDSGIDGTHPEFAGRVVAAKSFVGGTAYHDDEGHGTFVAGEIAASPFNNEGIAGLGFNVRLMIAKVVQPDGNVSLQGEVEAIHWAVDNGAKVINLSLGGVRDPLDRSLDTYSPLEQAAVQYAYSKGVVVVAAVGNGPQSPATPWGFAHYPAALPHVIGVSAIRENGSVPAYSNRDVIYNDLAAPGDAIFSTIPSNLEEQTPSCTGVPYSNCGPFEFRDAIGTSFAAPQVTAAAALLLGQDPSLRPEQVSWLLERSANDDRASTGCTECPIGRDKYTGWGTLDIEGALTLLGDGSSLPPADRYEPNDDAGVWSHALPPLPRTVSATLDYWDDNLDVYRIYLHKGAKLFARVTPNLRGSVRMSVWSPGTAHVGTPMAGLPLAQSKAVGAQMRLALEAKKTGSYYLELKDTKKSRAPVSYQLAVAKS